MIKYVCDMCGKPLLDNEDARYVVRIDVYAAYDPDDYPEDYDDMDAVDEILDELDDEGDDDTYVTFRFDLCPSCHKKYLDDPLARSKPRRIRFSDN